MARKYGTLALLLPMGATLLLTAKVFAQQSDESVLRAKQGDFDASGNVSCVQKPGGQEERCGISIARAGEDEATAIARFPNGFSRMLYFRDGRFTGANVTMAGTGTQYDVTDLGDMIVVEVDGQRYDLPAVLIFGE